MDLGEILKENREKRRLSCRRRTDLSKNSFFNVLYNLNNLK